MSWGKMSYWEKYLKEKCLLGENVSLGEMSWGKMSSKEKCLKEKCRREKCLREKCHFRKNVLSPLTWAQFF